MHVGDKIKSLREKAGLTQPELAAMTGTGKAGVPQQTIGQLEQKLNGSCRKMPLIAKALGVVLDDLIDESISVDQVRTLSEIGTTKAGGGSKLTIADLLAQMNEEYESADPDLKDAIDGLYQRYQEDNSEGIRIAKAIKELLAK